ncbi:hypothetical protein [Daejeonella sp.]|uniref:hypothetical protein n=1 Tax=Daejeonella sp. TaxID=2805397 RepID=UPI0025BE14AE|nr:hypothetical protein [Daejeonella sp.]
MCFVPARVFAQEQNILKQSRDIDYVALNPFLEKLEKQNDFVIAFRVLVSAIPDSAANYFVLTKNANQFKAFKMSIKLEELNLPNAKLELIWANFVQNGLLSMKDERDLVDVCPKKYHIYNAHSYEFTILSKGKIKTLTYYYPEYYDEACPGMDGRKKIINSVAIVELLKFKND